MSSLASVLELFQEFLQGMFLWFVFDAWDDCFQAVGARVEFLHFIFEIGCVGVPGIFGHINFRANHGPPTSRVTALSL